MPGPKPKPEALKFLSRDEILSLLAGPRKLRKARDYFLLALSYYSALRISEAVSMRHEYLQPEYGEVLVPSAKRKPGKRDRVCKHTGRILLRVPVLHGEEVIRGAKAWGEGRGWLFPTPSGEGHIGVRQAHKTFKRWAQVAKLDERISFHSLRHSAGSHVSDAVGGDVVLLRDFMRHSNIATTSEYLHTLPSKLERAREALKRWNRD